MRTTSKHTISPLLTTATLYAEKMKKAKTDAAKEYYKKKYIKIIKQLTENVADV